MDIQQRLFQAIKAKLNENQSLAFEIADVLKLTNDSAYRRLRGDKQLSLQETQKLCNHFAITPDWFYKNDGDKQIIPFEYHAIQNTSNTFYDQLARIKESFSFGFANVEMIHISNDLSLFQLLQVPELTAFKLFFWSKTNHSFKELKNEKFSLERYMHYDESINKALRVIVKNYLDFPSVDIIGNQAITFFLNQISYYYDSGFFETKDDALILLEKLKELIQHYKKQAELGVKFLFKTDPRPDSPAIKLYANEIMNVNSIILAKVDHMKKTFVTTSGINFLESDSEPFYDVNYEWALNLMKKSIYLTEFSERERNKIFLEIDESINEQILKISQR